MPKVYNKRRSSEIPKGAVYVGRPTQWGNPFSNGSKDQNISDFVNMLKSVWYVNRSG